jgi:hypothetical protein
LNKISQNKDFELSFTKNGIVNQINQEYKNYLDYPEDKSFSALNFINLENKSKELNYEIDNDYSINSLDDLHSSKKSELELEFDLFSKNILINENMENDININKHLKNNNIPFPLIKKYDISEEPNNQIHLTTYGDFKDDDEQSEKNENELTNQNSGIFNKIKNRKINKIRKKLKFLILEEKKQSKVLTQKEKENGKASNTPDFTLKELFEKNIIKKYKYKCEHSGCTKTFRTLKLKLNRHDLSDINCKKDTITLLYMVNNVKKLLKREKRKNSTRINRLQKLYKKCIYSLPHKDYAINIAGNHLIN